MQNMFNVFQQLRSGHNHDLFHEAQRRAQQPQPIIKHRRPKSLLLASPNNIIFELFNTIIKEIPHESLIEFITNNLRYYLLTNWTTKILQQTIKRLRYEQAIDVRAGLTSVPLIKFTTGTRTSRTSTTIVDVRRQARSPQSGSPPAGQQVFNQQTPAGVPPAANQHAPSPTVAAAVAAPAADSPGLQQVGSHTSLQSQTPRPMIKSVSGSGRKEGSPVDAEIMRRRQDAVNTVYEHLMWRIQSDNVTQASSLLIKLALDDGYRTGKLKSEPFEDVWSCFEDWRGRKLIKLYAFGAAPESDQKLVLGSTTAGDLMKWVANVIDGTEKRHKPDKLRILATSLRDKTKNCIFMTNELVDAIESLATGALRCVFLVDRLNRYEPITSMPNFNTEIKPLIESGKLYVMSSLACVEFAPDPSSDNCC